MKLVSDNTFRLELDQIEDIQAALAGFNDLLCPDQSIDETGRDHIASLFDFLMREQNARIDKLRQAVIAQKEPHHG